MLHNRQLGKLLVSFYPGDAIGQYSYGEEELQNLAQALGNYVDRVFDMYFEFTYLADEGLLLRREYGQHKGAMCVYFYYPPGVEIKNRRQLIINKLLNKYLTSTLYPRPGHYVVQSKNGQLNLINNEKNVECFVLTGHSRGK